LLKTDIEESGDSVFATWVKSKHYSLVATEPAIKHAYLKGQALAIGPSLSLGRSHCPDRILAVREQNTPTRLARTRECRIADRPAGEAKERDVDGG
jgi:hypothetical protein